MLDFGWSELLVVIVVAVLVIGPNDIPKVMITLGRLVRRMQYIKFAMSQQFEDIMKTADLDELRRVNDFGTRGLPDTDEAEADNDVILSGSEESQSRISGGSSPAAQDDKVNEND